MARWGWIPPVVAALLLWAPGIAGGSIVNGDDAIYASVIRRILLGGSAAEALGWRPPLFYGLTLSSTAALGLTELGLRLPSLLCGLGSVFATWWAGRALFRSRPEVAFWAASFLVVTSQYFSFARRVRGLDLLVTALVAVAVAVAASADGRNRRWAIVGLVLGLAVWTKSVVVLTIGPALFVLWWTGSSTLRARGLQAAVVAPIMLGMTAMWALWTRSGGAGMQDHVENHVVRRATSGSLVGGADTGVTWYIEQLVAHELLWALIALVSLATLALRAVRGGRGEGVVLAWALGVIVPFSLAATKLPHYLLPAYPALALGMAISVTQLGDALGERFANARATAPWLLGGAVLFVSVVTSPVHIASEWGHADFSPRHRAAGLRANTLIGPSGTLAVWNEYHVAAGFYFEGDALLWTDAPGFLATYRSTHGFVEGTHFEAVGLAEVAPRLHAQAPACVMVSDGSPGPVLETLAKTDLVAERLDGVTLFCAPDTP